MLTNCFRWKTSQHNTADICICWRHGYAPNDYLQRLQGGDRSQRCCPIRMDDKTLQDWVHTDKAVCGNGWKTDWIYKGKEAGQQWKASAVVGLSLKPFFQLALHVLHARTWCRGLMLPPLHYTHLMQPLDDVPFASLKKKYQQEILDYNFRHSGRKISKVDFFRVLVPAYTTSMTPKNIQSGYEHTGIYPVNPLAPKLLRTWPSLINERCKCNRDMQAKHYYVMWTVKIDMNSSETCKQDT